MTRQDTDMGRICVPATDLPEGEAVVARGFTLQTPTGPRELVVVRAAGEIRVFENACPHTGVALNWMPDQFLDIHGELLQCATHGALFEPRDGRCLRGPCVGQSLRRVAVNLWDGVLYLSADDGETA